MVLVLVRVQREGGEVEVGSAAADIWGGKQREVEIEDGLIEVGIKYKRKKEKLNGETKTVSEQIKWNEEGIQEI